MDRSKRVGRLQVCREKMEAQTMRQDDECIPGSRMISAKNAKNAKEQNVKGGRMDRRAGGWTAAKNG